MILNIIGLTFLFVGYLLTTGTGLFESDSLKSIFRFFCLLTLITNIVMEGGVNKNILFSIILLIFLGIISQSPLTANIIFLLIITASLYRLNEKELAITLLIPVILLVLAHAVLFFTGKISTDVMIVGDRMRASYGLKNANQISVQYFSLVAISVFSYVILKQRTTFIIMSASILLAFTILLKTDSRTSLFGIILLVCAILFNIYFIARKFYRIFFYLVGFLTPVFATIITIHITNSSGTELNEILSLRPYFFSQYISAISFLDILFGWNDPNNLQVDNLFLSILSAVGAIGFILILYFISIRTYKMRAQFIPLIVVMIVMSIIESFLLRPEIPASVLFVVILISPLMQRTSIHNNIR